MKRFVGFTAAMFLAAFAVIAAGSVAQAGWRHHRCHAGHAAACDTGYAVESCEPAPVVVEYAVAECVVEECAPSHGCHRRHRCGLFGHRRHCHRKASCEPVYETACVTVESSCNSCGGGEVITSGCAAGDCGGGEVISSGEVITSGEVISSEVSPSDAEVIKQGKPTPAEPAQKADEPAKATSGT